MGRNQINMRHPILHYNTLLIIYATTFLIIALISIQDNFLAKFLIRENGPIQTFTVIAYFMAFSTAAILQRQRRISFGTGTAIIMLTMGLRELDFHDRFTTMGIMKSRFYISDIVPLKEKIIVLFIVLTLLFFLGIFVKKYFYPFLTALKMRNTAAIMALNGIIFTFLSKLLDPIPILFFNITEECLELAIPCFFLSALLLSGKCIKTCATTDCF